MGIYVIGVTYTTTHGEDHVYTAINLSIQCAVESFTAPSNPPDLEYDIFGDMKFFNMESLTYTQTPVCGYSYTGAYTWSGTNGYVEVDDTDSGEIGVLSFNPD